MANEILKATYAGDKSLLYPKIDFSDHSTELAGAGYGQKPDIDIDFTPWQFSTIPGTKPKIQWPDSLPQYLERVSGLEPMTLWKEPYDV